MAAIFQIRRGTTEASLQEGELYLNQTTGSLQIGSGSTTVTLAKLNQPNIGNFNVTGDVTIGGTITIGDTTSDNLVVNADLSSSIIPNNDNAFDLGSTSKRYRNIYGNQISTSVVEIISSSGAELRLINSNTGFAYHIQNTPGGNFSIHNSATNSSIFRIDSGSFPQHAHLFGNLAISGSMSAGQVLASSFTGSFSGSINGIGNVTAYSTSVDLRLDRVEASSSLYDNAMSGSKRLYVSPSGSDSNTGLEPHIPFRTIKAAVESLGSAVYTNTKRYTIFVGSGEYVEQNPIAVPPGVAIVGDNLRTVRLTAANPTKDYFHCHDGNYFYGLRFLNLQNPSFCFSYPCSSATASISAGGVSSIGVVHSMTGYTNGNNQDLGIIIEGPDVSGSIATATANVVGGVITQINVVNAGTNYVNGEKPHISIPAPLAQRPIIGTSPYIQNCSSITGPFTTDGTLLSLVPGTTNYAALPYNVNDVRNQSGNVIGSGVIDEQGAGGGIRIDGNLVHPSSPLESFVADAFTQVNQGGPGHLVINKGYAQFVSCFTTFCTYGFKVVNGGFANISNSVIDFGKKGLVSKTYYPQTYNTAIANQSKYSSVAGFEITQDGAGYTGSIAAVSLTAPNIIGGTQATAEAVVSILGTITSVYITNAGTGYTSEPIVTIAPPTGPGAVQATANSIISGVTQMKMILSNTTQSVEISSNMILDGQNYLVTNVTTGSTTSEKLITTFPNPPQIVSGSNVYFHKLSNISTGGLVIEYGGSGVTYNALPKFGGIPDRTKEIVEIAPGRIFYSTVDNIGNLKIGEYFAVDQLTGEVTIDARNFNLSGINQIGPFRRNGLSVGEVLREVSDSVTLVNSQGVIGSDTVPTQYGVHTFVSSVSSSISSSINVLNAKNSTLASVTSSLNTFTASVNGHIIDINTKTGSFENKFAAIAASTSSLNTFSSSINTKFSTLGNLTGSYATTGSNSFNGNQTITGSLVISQNLTVLGSSSILTISSSTLNIGTNVITANTSTPGVRFGGLAIIDSGSSPARSGSLLFDSVNDNWIIIHQNAANVTSSVALMGAPTYNNVGNETYPTLNRIVKGLGYEHIGDSNISDTGTEISLNSLTSVTGSFIATGNIIGTIRATNGVISGSSQIAIVGTSDYTSLFGGIASATSSLNTFSSSQVTKDLTLATYTASIDAKFATIGSQSGSWGGGGGGGTNLHSGSTGDYQFNSIGVGTAATPTIAKGNFNGKVILQSGINTDAGSQGLIFSYPGLTNNLTHSIWSGHDASVGNRNKLDFYVSTTGGTTLNVLSLRSTQPSVIGLDSALGLQINGNLAVTGSITATNDITAFATSDIRLKQNIQPIQNALTKVNQISGNTYDWKEGYEEIHSHKGNDVGVIAQEIEAVLPQLVVNRDNGYKAVQYEKIIPLLIEAIKELSNKIDRLDNK